MNEVRSNAAGDSRLEELERLAPLLVGAGWVLEAQERLLRGMLVEALRRTAANYTRAGRLLGVKRQAIQQMVARLGLEGWAKSVRDREGGKGHVRG
jgi:transcriptional regulator with GAF, ATPase, and Fis domain